MVTRRANPTAKRRAVGAALKHIREERGLKPGEVAKQVDHDGSWLLRVERAEIRPHPDAVIRLLNHYEVTGPLHDAILDVARNTESRGWWHVFSRAIPDWFGKFVGLEGVASIIRNYQNAVIPGLLQTEDYARALTRAAPLPGQPADIDRFVQLRMERQELLTSDNPPEMRFVVDEAVICRPFGGLNVMRDQLHRLITLGEEHPNIKIMILPFEAGAHAGADGAFVLLDFPPPPEGFPDGGESRVVYLDSLVSALYLEEPEQITAYSAVWDSICGQALSADVSRRMLRKLTTEA